MAARETSKFMHRLGMTVRVPTKLPIIAKMPKKIFGRLIDLIFLS